MDKLNVDGATLAYQTPGSGHPVLMIHGAAIADTFVPLVRQPELGAYRAIRYHRRGYGDSTGTAASLPEHASDALALLEHLDAGPAHIIGHSYGGCTALQMALMSPQAVQSLILLEPAMITQIPSAEECASGLTPIFDVFAAGEGRRAVDLFLRTMCSTGLRTLRLAVDTHAITSHFAIPLLIKTQRTRDHSSTAYRSAVGATTRTLPPVESVRYAVPSSVTTALRAPEMVGTTDNRVSRPAVSRRATVSVAARAAAA